jgi:HSP20 family protein
MIRSLVPQAERLPRPFEGFAREMENLMQRFFGAGDGEWQGLDAYMPQVNVAETDAQYEVSVDVPGMKAEDVKVELQKQNLIVSGDRKEEKEEKGKTFHRLESSFGSFYRSIPLPGVVEEAKIEARCTDGVLKIVLPKSEKTKPKQIKVGA